jgi:soluble lytic murein transglycosylase-like protein
LDYRIVSLYMEQGSRWPLLLAQGWVESRLKPDARSPAGALGIAQFMPATWQEAIKRGWAPPGSAPTDPEAAIPAQASYLEYLQGQFRGNIHKALAAYNLGLGNVMRLVRSRKHWKSALPPETYSYVATVLALAQFIAEFVEEEDD